MIEIDLSRFYRGLPGGNIRQSRVVAGLRVGDLDFGSTGIRNPLIALVVFLGAGDGSIGLVKASLGGCKSGLIGILLNYIEQVTLLRQGTVLERFLGDHPADLRTNFGKLI